MAIDRGLINHMVDNHLKTGDHTPLFMAADHLEENGHPRTAEHLRTLLGGSGVNHRAIDLLRGGFNPRSDEFIRRSRGFNVGRVY